MTHEPNNEMFADPNRPAGDQLVVPVSGDVVAPVVQAGDAPVSPVDAVPIVTGQVVASPDQAAFAPADGSVIVDPNAAPSQPNPDAKARVPLGARLAARKKVSKTGSTRNPAPTTHGSPVASTSIPTAAPATVVTSTTAAHGPMPLSSSLPLVGNVASGLPYSSGPNTAPASPNQQPAVQTPNVAPEPSPQTPDTELVKADWEVRRDLFMELESARNEYINATVAGRVDSTKEAQKLYEAATEKYTTVRQKAIQLHADDMLSTGKTMDEVKQSITKLFIEDTHENERVISDGMIEKANEAQAIIDAAENPDMSTLKGKLAAGKELVYKMWTEGNGEKLLSKAGFKNRWKRSAITTAVTVVPGVAIGAVAATLAAPLVGLAGAGALTVAAGAAARGALRGGVNEFINRRAGDWRQSPAANPNITNAEEMRERTVNSNLQMATAYNNGVIDELNSDLLVAQDKMITLDMLDHARAKERQANKALRRKIGVFAVSSVFGVGVGAALRWGAGEAAEHVSKFVQDREFRLPSFGRSSDLPSLSSQTTTTEVTTSTSPNSTTSTTQKPTTTTATTSIPTTTVPESAPTPDAPPATPVPGEFPDPTVPDTGVLDDAAALPAKLEEIKADPAKSAAFDRMVSNPYEFGKFQSAVTELQVQNPGMSQAQIDQLATDNLDRASQHQIGQYLLGMKALEDQSGLKVGTTEFDKYANVKINEISDAEFAPTKTIIDGRINGSSLDSLQQTTMRGYANTDSVNGYQNGYTAMSQTIADSKRIGMSPAEINQAIVQSMTAVKGKEISDLLEIYDEDELAEMLEVYYGIAA